MSVIHQLLTTRKVLVCCGAGGVGKTTVSASLALAAARAGKRVLVVTIDPSKRLAETLGVSRNPEEPVQIPEDRLKAAGVTGTLSAWMLDPQLVSDNVVRGFSKSEEDAQRLLANPIYRNVTSMVAGMQEYTAVEAMHGFVVDDTYDLVVLDEITYMLSFDYLDEAQVIKAVQSRPEHQSVVLTGRGGGSGLQTLADTVSEVKEVKHAFRAGIKARKGVDY